MNKKAVAVFLAMLPAFVSMAHAQSSHLMVRNHSGTSTRRSSIASRRRRLEVVQPRPWRGERLLSPGRTSRKRRNSCSRP